MIKKHGQAIRMAAKSGRELTQEELKQIIADSKGDIFLAITISFSLGFQMGCERGEISNEMGE